MRTHEQNTNTKGKKKIQLQKKIGTFAMNDVAVKS